MDELYKQNAKIVYRFLYSLCHDEQLAEELTQETFLQAFKSLERFDESCKISTWLCQIAKHLYYQYLHKHKVTIELDEQMLNNTSNTEKQVLNKIELMEILKEMQKLPEKMREVMYLKISGDFTYKEIGEILGKSETWCRVNFYRGKEILLKGRVQDE